MKFSIIVAVNDQNLIGIKEYGKHSLPWPIITGDMKFFKDTTTVAPTGKINAMVVGYNTWNTLPKYYKSNANRINIIVCRNAIQQPGTLNEIYAESFEDALFKCEQISNINKVYVIGGSYIYHLALQHIDLEKIYITHIKQSFPVDEVEIEYGVQFPIKFTDLDKIASYKNTNNGSKVIDLESQSEDLYEKSKNIYYQFKVYCVTDHKMFYSLYLLYREETKVYFSSDIIQTKSKYLDLIRKIYTKGMLKKARNDFTMSIFGHQLRYNLQKGFPIHTEKKSYPKQIFTELWWMLTGSTDVRVLQKLGVHVWDKNSSAECLKKLNLPYREGDIGPGYGFQMRHFGAKYIDCDTDYKGQGIDQLQNCINDIQNCDLFNNPPSRRILIDLWNCVDTDKMALPPCFTPETLILTNRGYLPIVDVKITDYLMTHTGQFRRINKFFQTPYQNFVHNLMIDKHPYAIRCTPEHPFLVKNFNSTEIEWSRAKNLKIGQFIGFPINQQSWLPFDDAEGTDTIPSPVSNESTDKKMAFNVGFGFALNSRKSSSNCLTNDNQTSLINQINDRWMGVLENLVENQMITEQIHSMPKDLVEQFLRGYFYALDYKAIVNKNYLYEKFRTDVDTVQMALDLQRLALKIGVMTSVDIIEDKCYLSYDSFRKNRSHIKDDYAWYSINDCNEEYYSGYVYNFDVEVDHSYIVENLATHNCHYSYGFGVDLYDKPINNKRGRLNCHLVQRSWDVLLGWNTATAALFTYLLADYCDMDPGILVHSISDAHLYKTHIDSGAIDELLKRKPRKFPTIKILNSGKKNFITDYRFEDLQIENYYPCPAIEAEMLE